ncbi:16S rRNA (guanine(966)-N(2))-methyltransferase RsmD [bacterium]|nr:16S rRNA (guanine(966)-N(2))-methyltransferase RsmD [bacterium]
MLKLTGGEFRGRTIHTPSGDKTRPTQAKLRQALFNSIFTHLPDAAVLDLFSGSGCLGFEALSRGASAVVFVENSKPAGQVIRKNMETLEVEDRATLLNGTVEGLKAECVRMGPYDVVLADPPYERGWEMKLLTELDWQALLKPNGIFCLEWRPGRTFNPSNIKELPDAVPFLVKTREKNYGESILTTYTRSEGPSV